MNAPKSNSLPPKTSTEAFGSSLLSIHKNVLESLKSTVVSSGQDWSQKRLLDLQKHRILLASEISRQRSHGAEIKQNVDVIFRSHHLIQQVIAAKFNLLVRSDTDDDDAMQLQDSHPLSLLRARKMQRLVAANRLGGVTAAVPHVDPEVVSFRLHVCLEGAYVARYHAFFDLVTVATPERTPTGVSSMDDSPPPKLYLRLSQHTIPSDIPFLQLCQGTFGESLFPLGDLHSEERWRTDEFKECIQIWARTSYKACWWRERRKHAWHCLEKKQKQSMRRCSPTGACTGHLRIDAVTTKASNPYDQISFDLWKLWCSAEGCCTSNEARSSEVWRIQLSYADRGSGLPSEVEILTRQRLRRQQATKARADISCKTESAIHPSQTEVAQEIQKQFLEYPIKQALAKVWQLQLPSTISGYLLYQAH